MQFSALICSYNYLQLFGGSFRTATQVSSTLESESIPTRHGLAGRTTAPGLGRLNLTVVR